MDKKFAIFDMDGTLVDSMGYWRDLASEFLHSKGVGHIPGDVLERIKPMTMTESAAFFIQRFSLTGTPESVAAEINAKMEEHYRNDILLKAGAEAYLAGLYRKGVQLCVASATAERLIEACLRRLDGLKYFSFVLSCESVGAGKTKPDVYLKAAERLKAAPAEISVYEDALYAVKTAKRAGFYVVGVYDESAAANWEEIKQLSHEALECW